ncbi:sensor histidine kinase [Leeuwenhoekiella parthenopeia]|uniref:histidine kinase n=1 Tax=Leeuwenhoekiella parthenopeia TaxID=2890320 RepID=A0ABS8GXM3_9FLAO|nr:GAF domain-containing sensor histidine kinase [Leeuwenhoekiella parthenopeia]MCC4214228.1 GAF domain-containing sensor histidine kinase [Leeuwenhoekiella parthenopeia]
MNPKDFRRVKKLAELDLDYQELKEELTPLSKLAAQIAGTELSEVNFIDNFTQWTVASTLGGFCQKPREEAICNYTIEEEKALMIQLPRDPRFENSTYVVDEGYKLYYGIPLKFDDNIAIGALCVAGKSIEDLDDLQIKHLHLIARQIVKQLELRFELKQAQDAVLKERKLKRQLAHDVRSPLSGISQLVQLTDLEDSPRRELVQVINLIASSAESVLSLTDEILNELLIEDEFNKSKSVFTFESLGTKLRNLYKPQAEAKQIDFEVTYDSLKREFTGKNLLPLIGNLVSNAIKFTHNGGRVSVHLSLTGLKPIDEKINIRVEDTGVGMTSAQIEAISMTDFRDRLQSSDTNGFGMGLLFVRELIEDLGGDLEISSQPNKGTQITIALPLI